MARQISKILVVYMFLTMMMGLNLYADENKLLLSIKELSDQGRHFDAVLLFKEQDSNHSLGDILAAANSSWALGLCDEARKRWDEALYHPQCRGVERGRVYLSRAIMELQESQYEKARSFAEEGVNILDASELRAELNFVIAEALFNQELFSIADGYYKKTIKEGTKDRVQEALLKLARVKEELGQLSEARDLLVKIELTSKHTPAALRHLIRLDNKTENYNGVRTWIEEGRSSFPSEFRSSVMGYQHASALMKEGLVLEAEEEINYIKNIKTKSDPWYQLGRALVESQRARELLPKED